jgi:hypothetical protein
MISVGDRIALLDGQRLLHAHYTAREGGEAIAIQRLSLGTAAIYHLIQKLIAL